MIPLSPRAKRQIDGLQRHFLRKERPEAARNLIAALHEALERIERNPDAGIAAPRPYPHLGRPRWAWIKVGRYWFGYVRDPEPMIGVIFYDTADIPGRF